MGRPKAENPKRNHIQPAFTDDEYALIREACRRRNIPAREIARNLMIAWIREGLSTRGGVRGGICGTSRGCNGTPANWFNPLSRIWLCEDCAENTNRRRPGLCTTGPDEGLSVAQQEEIWRRMCDAQQPQKAKTTSQLLEEALAILKEVRLRTKDQPRTLTPGFLVALPDPAGPVQLPQAEAPLDEAKMIEMLDKMIDSGELA